LITRKNKKKKEERKKMSFYDYFWNLVSENVSSNETLLIFVASKYNENSLEHSRKTKGVSMKCEYVNPKRCRGCDGTGKIVVFLSTSFISIDFFVDILAPLSCVCKRIMVPRLSNHSHCVEFIDVTNLDGLFWEEFFEEDFIGRKDQDQPTSSTQSYLPQ
jgi:hypothetical protein